MGSVIIDVFMKWDFKISTSDPKLLFMTISRPLIIMVIAVEGIDYVCDYQ